MDNVYSVVCLEVQLYLLGFCCFVSCVLYHSCDQGNPLSSPDPAANLHHSPELGHIHRGGSCTEKSTFSGYIALFYSVISYAVFEVGYKKWGSEEGDPASVANSLRFLGYLGINTLAWLWPGFLILHYSGVEPFEWPPYDIFILLLWNALLDIVFNAGLLICIALSSALFASVGTILVIPAAVLVDWLLQGFILQSAAAFGVVFIIIGFIGFVTSEIVALKTKGKVCGLRIKDGCRIAPLLPAASRRVTKIEENGFYPHDAAMWYGEPIQTEQTPLQLHVWCSCRWGKLSSRLLIIASFYSTHRLNCPL
jgi:hypothetical protein